MSVPDYTECELTGSVIVCDHGSLAVGQVDVIQPVSLASMTGATPGDAGSVVVTSSGDQEDENPGDNKTNFPVTMMPSGPDLAALVGDIGAPDDRVGPGDTAPLLAALFNEGDFDAEGFAFTFRVSTGATFGERYSDCTYGDFWPGIESTRLICNGESEWPTVFSGFGTFSQTVRVKIKSAPGQDGTIEASSLGPSTEANPANNIAKIVINTPLDGFGGLPATGASTGLVAAIGAVAVVLGFVLVLLGRRRRVASSPDVHTEI